MNFIAIVDRIRFFGVHEEKPYSDEARRVALVNTASLILALPGIPYFFLFLYLRLALLAFLIVPFLALYFSCVGFNYFQKFTAAKLGILVFPSAAVVCFSLLLGLQSGIYLSFFGIAALALILFHPKEKKYVLTSFSIPIMSWFLLETGSYFIRPQMIFPHYVYLVLQNLSLLTAFFVIFLCIRFYMSLTQEHEETLQASNTQLQEANQNLKASHEIIESLRQQAVLGSIVRGIAHEVRNPIASIHACCSMILNKKPEPFLALEIESIQEQVMNLSVLTTTLLRDTGAIVNANVSVNMHAVLDQLLRLVNNEAYVKKVTLSHDIPDVLPSIKGTAAYISQAILNILVNALAHTPEGGEVHVSAVVTDQTLTVKVRDTGPGISEEILPQIFEANVTTVGSPKTMGFGLHFVKRIMESHQGTVSVASSDEGCVFTLVFPVE